MVPFVVWFVFHIYLIWSPHLQRRTLQSSAVWMLPFSFFFGAWLLEGEWYAAFFLSNSVFAAIQLLAAASLYSTPLRPVDAELAIASGSQSLLRVLMTIVTLASTIF
jgi:hypothetical protein